MQTLVCERCREPVPQGGGKLCSQCAEDCPCISNTKDAIFNVLGKCILCFREKQQKRLNTSRSSFSSTLNASFISTPSKKLTLAKDIRTRCPKCSKDFGPYDPVGFSDAKVLLCKSCRKGSKIKDIREFNDIQKRAQEKEGRKKP